MLQVTNDVANADDAPQWTDKPARNLDEARALNRIATLLLDAEKQKPLTDVQRLIVMQAKIRTDKILKRGEMTAEERTWLTRLAQLMLLSVF